MIDVGSKVVCIISSWHWQPDPGPLGILVPKENHVYTVRGVITHRDRWVGILLHEIHNGNYPRGDYAGEACFNIKAFRPLEKKQTSIEAFTKILDNAPKQLEPA